MKARRRVIITLIVISTVKFFVWEVANDIICNVNRMLFKSFVIIKFKERFVNYTTQHKYICLILSIKYSLIANFA